MKFWNIAVALCAIGFCPSVVMAGSCTALLDDFASFTKNSNNEIRFKMEMNTTNMKWVQYTEGSLRYKNGGETGARLNFYSLAGEGKQYFSDRLWATPNADPGPFGNPADNPFDPSKTDKLGVNISLSPIFRSGDKPLTFTLLSWGSTKSRSAPKCNNGLMYGFVEGGMYVISFQKQTNPR